jgi:hypothetical protein
VRSLQSKSRISHTKRVGDMHSGNGGFPTHFPLVNPKTAVLIPISRTGDRAGIGQKNMLYHLISFIAPTDKICRSYKGLIF